jgi:hypothetical protein
LPIARRNRLRSRVPCEHALEHLLAEILVAFARPEPERAHRDGA